MNYKKGFTPTPTLVLRPKSINDGFTPTPTFLFKKEKLVWGFTLIELIMVVSIIALITAIVLSSLASARRKGNDTAKIQTLHEVRSALQLYFTDNESYPGGDENSLVLSLVNGPKRYIPSINSNIKYRGTNVTNSAACSSNCASYHLGIALEQSDNSTLKSDKDLNVGFPGLSIDCSTAGATIDSCYDITP